MAVPLVGPKITREIPNSPETSSGRFSNWIPTVGDITSNIKKVAVPAMLLFAMSNIPVAAGGPMAYGLCTASCCAWMTPILLPACVTACLPLLAAPTP